jgi:1,2-diacylglycerol 3-alpha-glucosyltransferase
METQGLTILEAMSCGLPVVGVKKYAIPDLVMHGINGYIAKPFDEKQIKDYIKKFIDHPRLLKMFGEKSVEIAKNHDLNKVACKLEGLYSETSKKYAKV